MDEFRMERREALKVWAMLVGTAVLPGILTGCDDGDGARATVERAARWVPRALTREQAEMVAIMAEHVIPETDTPGAREVRVHEFIDAVVAAFMPAQARQRFIAGLDRVEQRAKRAFGTTFLAATPAQQLELVEALNEAAYADGAPSSTGPRRGGRNAADPKEQRPAGLQEGEAGVASGGGGAAARAATAVPGGPWDPSDVGRESFFLTFKRLVIEGYYTSEVGATQELRLNPMGAWRADIAYSEVGRAYS